MNRVHGLLRIPPADARVEGWHVSSAVDIVAYAFSWLWVLVPLLLVGDQHPVDYLVLYIIIMTATFTHRHFTLPYVYFDRQVFQQNPGRFVVFPAVMMAAFLVSPFAWGWNVPAASLAKVHLVGILAALSWATTWGLSRRRSSETRGRLLVSVGLLGGVAVVLTAFMGEGSTTPRWPATPFPLRHVVAGIAFFAGVWNLWHVYSQKYGIQRLYNAKSGFATKVPGWVDRFLVFGWIPLYFVWLGPAYKADLRRYFPTVREYTMPTVEAMERLQPFLLVPAIGLVAGSIALFLRYEWKSSGLRSAPRLWMALGMTLLSASFLVVNPAKAYMAFAFSHALEYMVFVWAYQRRRYNQPLAHRPLLGRLLQRPLLAYGAFILVVGGAYFLGRNVGRTILTDMQHPSVWGVPAFRWIFYWGVYQSMVHFYFDGFLWKMRMPAIRQNI